MTWVTVSVPQFRQLTQGIEGDIAEAATDAMRETSPEEARELREQVVSAGLGARLANTWRWRAYPDKGARRNSLTPAGLVWSRAPDIIEPFTVGATIRPANGRRYLWIPTASVPRARSSGRATSRKRMTPPQVEHTFNTDFILRKGKRRRLLAFIDKARGTTKAGKVRAVRRGRLAHGADHELVLMFTLVPTVRLPKLLDLDGPAERWTRRFEAAFTRNLGAKR